MVAFHKYPRPIPSPVKDLRPARATCEHCHWPQRFTGDKFVVKTNYTNDEKNTPQTTALLVKVGGRTWQGSVGIHGRHLDDGSRVQYIASDVLRQVIPIVYYSDDKGKTIEFVATDRKIPKQQLEKGEKREMDCIDCHNRPTHTFEMPDNAVDEQMSVGRIAQRFPSSRKRPSNFSRRIIPIAMTPGSASLARSTIFTRSTTHGFTRRGGQQYSSPAKR
jgi:hypothetical protein